MASILKREEMAKMIDGKGKRRRGSPRSCAVVHVELWISGSCPFEGSALFGDYKKGV